MRRELARRGRPRASTAFAISVIGAAPWRLLPRRIAARARISTLADQTAFLDRLLMRKLRLRDCGDAARGKARG